MSDWKAVLKTIDDEYLIGMSNKGIVKRAYKDKEENNYQVLSTESDAAVSVGEETVIVKLPLAQSTCTCPSRSICRHVILGILALQEYMLSAQEAQEDDAENSKGENSVGDELLQTVKNELDAFAITELQKLMSNKQVEQVLSLQKAGQYAKITYASAITVKLPGQDTIVKLLSPLEYATCTCHKKELCVHKAEAILWYKLEQEQITGNDIEGWILESNTYDVVKVQNVAFEMKQFIEELLDTGVSRTSPDAMDHMERLAIICHRYKLASFEGYWRNLKATYEKYVKRMASFQIQQLMNQLTRLYRRTELLLQAQSNADIAKYAGEFKAQYQSVGTLDLIGIAMEHFENKSGYAGETVYFLEAKTKEWYTYTVARPEFYEKKSKNENIEKTPAPWGLAAALEDLVSLRIKLSNAKCDARHRLSASQETKGEIIGERNKTDKLKVTELVGWYYQDFGMLLKEQLSKDEKSWLKEETQREQDMQELVFVRPVTFEDAVFSGTEQRLSMKLYDSKGKELVVELPYSKQEAWGIRYLERLKKEKEPCFLGRVYLKGARIRMYPIAVFEKGEILDETDERTCII